MLAGKRLAIGSERSGLLVSWQRLGRHGKRPDSRGFGSSRDDDGRYTMMTLTTWKVSLQRLDDCKKMPSKDGSEVG